MNKLKIAIDARLQDGRSGGIQQVVIGLAHGLSQLTGGDEEFHFLVYPDREDHAWLKPYLGGACRLLPVKEGPTAGTGASRWNPQSIVNRLGRYVSAGLGGRKCFVPTSDGTIEREGIDVMHFTLVKGFRTQIPSIFHPHDLQHRHLPEYFDWRTRTIRDRIRQALCQQADVVGVMTEWGRQDLIDLYGTAPDKVHVIPWAPTQQAYAEPSDADAAELRTRLDLPDAFAFYPSKTYPHKNHLGLLDAVSLLQDEYGLNVPLVFSGPEGEAYPEIVARIRERKLESLVRHVGFVSPADMTNLYRLCRCVVFPTRFEGWGFPLTEAFFAGAPVACSNATCLPEIAGDAALLFDPMDVPEMAQQIRRLWTDADLRTQLAERGVQRVSQYQWVDVARQCQQLYHQITSATSAKQRAA